MNNFTQNTATSPVLVRTPALDQFQLFVLGWHKKYLQQQHRQPSLIDANPNHPLFAPLKEGVSGNSPLVDSLNIVLELKKSFSFKKKKGGWGSFMHGKDDSKGEGYLDTEHFKYLYDIHALKTREAEIVKIFETTGFDIDLYAEMLEIESKLNSFSEKRLKKYENWQPVWTYNYLMYSLTSSKGYRFHRHLLFDIDDWDGDLEFIKALKPHWIITNPDKPKSLQIGFLLNEAIVRKVSAVHTKQSAKIEAFDYIRQVFNKILNGDPNFKMNAAKNPLGEGLIHPQKIAMRDSSTLFDYPLYSLDELWQLAVFLDYEVGKQMQAENNKIEVIVDESESLDQGSNPHYQFDPNSRNCLFFDWLRLHPHVNFAGDFYKVKNGYQLFTNLLTKTAETYAGIRPPEAEIRATIKSVVKYYLRTKRLTRDQIDTINKRKAEKKMQAIAIMKQQLKPYFDENPNFRLPKELSQKLANELGLSEKTIRTYTTIVRKELEVKPFSEFEEIERMRAQGFRWERIAKSMNNTIEAVKKIHQRGKKKQAENAFLAVL